ncbi:hypothetical protein ACIP6P_12900 [Streptomyces sp. NPDC088729]|uniref:hypothetical protein n=1 Tax=unclassified Streptomyces TaxID=2593676 RepID=UPI000F54C9B1|nr:hypothetical protein [Streptomyces sp. ADI96-02]
MLTNAPVFALPTPAALLDRCRVLAAVSALLDGHRAPHGAVYTIGLPRRGAARRGAAGPVFSLRRGGSRLDVLFRAEGVLLWGRAGHGPGRHPRAALDGVPEALRPLLPEQPVDVVAWCGPDDAAWRIPRGAGSGSASGAGLLDDLVAVRPQPLKWTGRQSRPEAVWDLMESLTAAPAWEGDARKDGPPGARADVGEELLRCRDRSGRITTAVFRRRAGVSRSHCMDLRVGVDDDMVVIGGGAVGEVEPYGALLTASFPSDDGRAWVVASKDHAVPQPHRVTGYAIGLKIEGVSRRRLAEELLLVHRVRSEQAPHPAVSAAAPEGFTLIGGGIRANWHDGTASPGPGSLATASFPRAGEAWTARAKDHLHSHPCTVDAYAVCLKSAFRIDGRDVSVDRHIRFAESSGETPAPRVSTALGDTGHALTGIGAEVRQRDPGSLLWQLAPVAENGTVAGVSAGGKQHEAWAPSSIAAWTLGIRLDERG